MKMLEDMQVAAVLLEYKTEGMDAEAVACHVKRRFPGTPIILLSPYCLYARANTTVVSG
jgi:hypothetical protein